MFALQIGSFAGVLPQLAALAQVLFIDLALAGDNAVVIGLAVAGLAPRHRRAAVLVGIAAATIIRIGLATVALQLLAIVGLTLAGGLLLLWVCVRMARELRPAHPAHAAPAPKSLAAAILQIILADLSMSLDNVLAVAGAANGHVWVLAAGLAVSIVLMAVAATLIARVLERYRWVAWFGLLVVLFVACKLIWEGGGEVAHLPEVRLRSEYAASVVQTWVMAAHEWAVVAQGWVELARDWLVDVTGSRR